MEFRMHNYYKVAGHCFSIQTEMENFSNMAGNYCPFQIQTPDEEPLFSLEITDSLPEGNASVFYKEGNIEPDMPQIDIYSQAGGYLIEMRPVVGSSLVSRLWTAADFRKGLLHTWNQVELGRFPLDNSCMILFAMASAPKQTLAMHASVIECEGQGYLFLGKSGTGKSTHSRLWLENIPHSRLLNDDNPVVGFTPQGELKVYGTPWSGKTPCYINDSVQVGAFVDLAQYPENRIRRMGVLESIAAFIHSCSGLRKIESIADGLDDTMVRILETVPVYHLDCLPDKGAAILCHETVIAIKS